jgi:high affinity Mn2+ porin
MKSAVLLIIVCTCAIGKAAFAQSVDSTSRALPAQADSAEAWSMHFQFTMIQQKHPPFSAAYSGLNSLGDSSESDYSVTSTLFLGRTLWRGAEIYLNPELAGGSGFSLTRGVAGFPNGEVYRVDDPSPKITTARLFLRQRIALGGDSTESIDADENQLAGTVSKSRLTLTGGKFSLTDIFDNNAYSHDPRTQFTNWAMWAPGAWDYAADTRGYTWGIAAELDQEGWDLNFAYVLMPTFANGPYFDMNLPDARSLNLEFIKPYNLFSHTGKVHVIGFLNRADMGNYRDAITEAAASGTAPDVTKTRAYSSKYGFAVSLEQPLSETVGFFSRLSWDDGKTETFVFTEIDRSFQVGVNVTGNGWNRAEDNVGIGYVVNGLSQDHRDYLEAGGYGFLIGDGRLSYGLEQINETFYDAKITHSFSLTLDNQLILNPGYNKDRGPLVEVIGIRAHEEF